MPSTSTEQKARLTVEHADQLIDLLAHTVSPEALRSVNYRIPDEYRTEFSRALEHFDRQEFSKSAQLFQHCEEIAEAEPGTITAAARNHALALYKADESQKAFLIMDKWFQGNRLYGSPLWNYAIIAIRVKRYDNALQALIRWVRQPVHYMRARCYLLLASVYVCIGNEFESDRFLKRAIAQDEQYVLSRLEKVGFLVPGAHQEFFLAPETKQRFRANLETLLIPRKPERFPQLRNMPISDFQFAVRAIDNAADNDYIGALLSLEKVSQSRESRTACTFIEASVRLLKGDVKIADELIRSLGANTRLPGAILWNWAAIALSSNDFGSCAERLEQCIQTEYSTKIDAYLALLLTYAILGDLSACKTMVARIWNHRSPRAKGELSGLLKNLDQRLLNQLGFGDLTFKGSDTGSQVEQELDLRKFQELVRKDVGKANELLEEFTVSSVRDVPEYLAMALIPSFISTVPRRLIHDNQQKEFSQGIKSLIQDEPEDAIAIFRRLSDRHPNMRILKVNLLASLYKANRFVEAYDLCRRLLQVCPEMHRASTVKSALACLVEDSRFVEANKLIVQEEEIIGTPQKHLYLAIIAEIQGRDREQAEQLFDLVKLLPVPSLALVAFSIAKCRDVKDHNRAKLLLDSLASNKPVKEGIRGSTSLSWSPELCRKQGDMKKVFDVFRSRKDWRASVDFFHSLERIAEQAFYGTDGKTGLMRLLNAKAFLGRSLAEAGRKRAACECLVALMELIKHHRERINPAIEASLSKFISESYRLMGANYMVREALEVAVHALPTDAELVSSLKDCNAEDRDLKTIERSASRLLKAQSALFRERNSETLESMRKSSLELLRALDVVSGQDMVKLVFDFAEGMWIQRKLPSEKEITDFVSCISDLITCVTLNSPQQSRANIVESFIILEEQLEHSIEELKQPICDVSVLESNHDGTSATLVLQFRSFVDRPIGPVEIKLSKPKGIEVVGSESLNLEIEMMAAGQSRILARHFGIVREWSAEEKVRFQIEIQATDEDEKKSLSQTITPIFTPFDLEQEYISYPGGAMAPEDVDNNVLYGREEIVNRLSQTLAIKRQSRLHFLFGPRKVGKTSILNFVVQNIQKSSPKFLCAHVNLDRNWPNDSPVSRISRDLLRAAERRSDVDLKRLREGLPTNLADLEDWIDDLKEIAEIEHVVILLDEFGKLISHLKSKQRDDNFLGDLRHLWMSSHSISLLIADWHPIDQLASWVPAQFWADVDVIRVGFLDDMATRQAIRGPIGNTKYSFPEESIEKLYDLTQGYPWHLQELCDLTLREVISKLQFVVTIDDIECAAAELLVDPRTFTEGMFRSDQISVSEEIVLWTLCRYSERIYKALPINLIKRTHFSLLADDTLSSIENLVNRSILLVEGDSLRVCSPLAFRWLLNQFESGNRISDEQLPQGIALEALKGCALEGDVGNQIQTLVAGVFSSKRRIKELCELKGFDSPFKLLDYSEERNQMLIPVQRSQDWDNFLKKLKFAFVDDVEGALDRLKTGSFRLIEPCLQQIRLRRNYSHHPESASKAARAVELEQRHADIGGFEPSDEEDWLRLQVGLLKRLQRAFEAQISDLDSVS